MNWQSAVERTVTGLGYDLVDAERSVGGLLRVFIDHLPGETPATSEARFITVDDCEKVTRQLQHVLEVEDCAYERLEVSSPGLDRPLKRAVDFTRFAGEQVEVTLKLPFKGRKKYHGELQASGDGWRLLLAKDDAKKPARRAATGAAVGDSEPAGQALDFSLEEVREARLVPAVDFKGRRFGKQGSSGATPRAGAPFDEEVDGGRIQ